MIDALDTLVVSFKYSYNIVELVTETSTVNYKCQVLGELDIFEDSVKKIVKEVNFDNDIVVSVFEANIRVVG